LPPQEDTFPQLGADFIVGAVGPVWQYYAAPEDLSARKNHRHYRHFQPQQRSHPLSWEKL